MQTNRVCPEQNDTEDIYLHRRFRSAKKKNMSKQQKNNEFLKIYINRKQLLAL